MKIMQLQETTEMEVNPYQELWLNEGYRLTVEGTKGQAEKN